MSGVQIQIPPAKDIAQKADQNSEIKPNESKARQTKRSETWHTEAYALYASMKYVWHLAK